MTEPNLQSGAPPLPDPPTQPARPAPAGWVPVDQRVGGFDRASIWPGVVLLLVWVLWAHVTPWINDRIAVDDRIVAGDLINLGAGEVTFKGSEGWNLESGFRVVPGAEDKVQVPASASLSSDVVLYSAKSGNWDGTTDELLDRMLDIGDALDQLVAKDEQARVDIQNADGVPGRLLYVVGQNEAVLVAAYVFETGSGGTPIGVEIEVRGQPDDLQAKVQDVAGMMESTTYQETSS